MLTLEWKPLTTSEQFGAQLSAIKARIIAELSAAINASLFELQRGMREDKLSGQVLNVRTGNLRNSVVVQPVEQVDGKIVGAMGVSRAAWYGKIHEYGGTFTAHRKTFPAGGLTRRGKPYKTEWTMTFPERSFFRSTFSEQTQSIRDRLQAAFGRALEASRV